MKKITIYLLVFFFQYSISSTETKYVFTSSVNQFFKNVLYPTSTIFAVELLRNRIKNSCFSRRCFQRSLKVSGVFAGLWTVPVLVMSVHVKKTKD